MYGSWKGIFKAHRLWVHSTLGLRVIKKKKAYRCYGEADEEVQRPGEAVAPPVVPCRLRARLPPRMQGVLVRSRGDVVRDGPASRQEGGREREREREREKERERRPRWCRTASSLACIVLSGYCAGC